MTAAIEIESVRRRLEAGAGGYEVVHASPGLELGVYVLVAPEPDRQQPLADDEVYVVLDGRGTLEIEGESVELGPGQAAFVPAGARTVDDRTTRLITRSSGDYDRRSVAVGLRLIGHPIHFAVQRKQLLKIRRQVETASPSAA